MTDMWLVSYVVLWVLVAVLAVALLGTLRHLGILIERIQTLSGSSPVPTSLKQGEHPPDLTLRTLSGEPTSLRSFAGRPVAFAVVSAGCGYCRELLRAVASRKALEGEGVAQFAVLSMNGVAATAELLRGISLPPDVAVLVDDGGRIKERWGVRGTPVTVVVAPDFTVTRQIMGPALDTSEKAPNSAAHEKPAMAGVDA